MLDSKQRAKLRGYANTLQPLTQVGKGGITEALTAQIDEMLTGHELVKLSVLENSGLTARSACDELCARCGADPVQVIGRKIVIFRRNPEKSAYVL